jgi:hypothetical protein
MTNRVHAIVRAPGVLLLGALFWACSAPEAERAGGVLVSDSAGIRIVDNGRLDPEATLLATTEPLLRIGVVEGPSEFQLFRVSDAKRLSDGGVAVANAGSRELRIYNSDGSHRATAGGAGRGPSEFQYPAALTVLPGDTIQVQDFLDRVYFTADGTFARRETMDRSAFAALWSESGGRSEGGQWLADGTLFAPVYQWNRNPPVEGPLFRPRMTLVRISADLAQVDTLGEFGGILQQYVDVGGGRGPSANVPPFATNTSWALGSADGSVLAGDNAAPQIHRFLPDGSRMIVRWSSDRSPVSDSEVEEWKDEQRSAEWTQDQLPELERAWADMDVPGEKPYYGRISSGSDGTIWVSASQFVLEPSAFRAFSADGVFQGQMEVPGRFTPHDSGEGWVLGVLRDESDVEFLAMFELRS